jgi:inner membrane protein
MASLITHAVVGAAIGQAGKAEWRRDWRYWLALIGGSMLPDIDSIGFHMGVPYGSLWGHRGLTHSLLFAALIAATVSMSLGRLFQKQWALALLLFAAIASHGLLDAMTNGGLGVAFFSPIDTHRYFLPWRPVLVSPIGISRFFTSRAVRILGSEVLYIWVPALILVVFMKFLRILRIKQAEGLPLSNSQD